MVRFNHSIVVDPPHELSYDYLESKMFQAFLGIHLTSTYVFGLHGLGLSGLSSERAVRWWLLSDLQLELGHIYVQWCDLQWELNNLANT